MKAAEWALEDPLPEADATAVKAQLSVCAEALETALQLVVVEIEKETHESAATIQRVNETL